MTKEDLLEAIADDYLATLRAGKSPPPITYYIGKCPALEEEIRGLIQSLKHLENFSQQEMDRRKSHADRQQPVTSPTTLGDFEIVREIGRGGMGTVYLAADRVLDRRVALKVLDIRNHGAGSSHQPSLEDRKQRFQREARLASRLHHTNIVPVFGVGNQGEHFYYAMQFIDGVDLRRILSAMDGVSGSLEQSVSLVDQARDLIAFDLDDESGFEWSDDTEQMEVTDRSSAGIPVGEPEDASSNEQLMPKELGVHNSPHYWMSVARIGYEVADALCYAHSAGVLHRDIKPSNLILDREGTTWVTDFGLAKLNEEDDLTRTGNLLGTLRYMAPEQLEGRDSFASDIYSLGLTLYELLTLRPAHSSTTYKGLLKEKSAAIACKPREIDAKIPKDLETIVLKSSQPDQAGRYRNAREMRDDLQRFLEDRPVTARQATSFEKALRWCRRNRTVASLGCAVALLLVTLSTVLAVAYRRESAQRTSAEYNRERAEQRWQIAMDGLDAVFNSVVSQDITVSLDTSNDLVESGVIPLTPETAKFLANMLPFYDKLATDDPEASPRLLQDSARAFKRVGGIYQLLGQYSLSLEAYADARSRYELVADVPQFELAEIDFQRARILQQQEQRREANDVLDQAIAEFRSSTHPKANLMLARSLLLRGHRASMRPAGPPLLRDRQPPRVPLQPQQREQKDPAPELASGLKLVNALLTQDQRNRTLLLLKAQFLRELSPRVIFYEGSQSNRAEAVRILEKLAEEVPENPSYLFELSLTYRQVSPHQLSRAETPRAIDQLQKSRQYLEELVAEYPQVARFRIELAHTYANLGMLFQQQQELRLAEEFNRAAVDAHRYVIQNIKGLKSTSQALIAGPTLALSRLLREQGRSIESMTVLGELEETLTDLLANEDLTADVRAKAKDELDFCHQLQEEESLHWLLTTPQ